MWAWAWAWAWTSTWEVRPQCELWRWLGEWCQFEHLDFNAVTIAIDTMEAKESAHATPNVRLPCRQTSTLKLKVDTSAEGNILPLKIYHRIFPGYLDAGGYPMASKVKFQTQVKFSTYNESNVWFHYSASSFKKSGWHTLKFFIMRAPVVWWLGARALTRG